MDEDPATINGQPYPIALGEQGQTLWETTDVAQERDEIWDDWSLGMGETKRETGRGYLFARGFDPSANGALRLSPHYQAHNNTALTTGYGYMMEDVETTGSTLTLDAASTGKGSVADEGTLTISHTIASQSERLLAVGVSVDIQVAPPIEISATYAGVAMTVLGIRDGTAGNAHHVHLFFLRAPATGTNDIVITNHIGSTRAFVVGAESFYGVNQDDSFGTAVSALGTNGTPTVTVVTASGEQILAVLAVEGAATIAAGTNETERWDDTQGSDVSGSGYTQAGSDGGVIAPSLTSGSNWGIFAVPIKPSSTTSRSVMWIGDTTKLYRYTYDSDTGLSLDGTQTIASGVCGRPEKTNSKWYAPMGSGTNARRLDDASSDSGWADAGWKANHLSNFQKGVQPTLARVNSTTANTVELNDDTSGNVGDTWTNESEAVGDSSTDVTDLVEAQGQLFVAKEDSLFAFGSEAESFNAIPFLNRGKADSDNGKGTIAFGDMIFYPSKGNWWRYRIGRGALPVGANTIRSWRPIARIDSPKAGRVAFAVYVEEYLYYLLNDGELSYLIQARLRREGDPAGHELIQHSVLTIPLSKGLGVDSKNRLWIKGASTDETTRDIRVIELADDGSLDKDKRRGQADEDHIITFDERNPGRPQDQVQLRHFTVETEGDWDATTSLFLAVFRDDSQFAVSVGSTVTSTGVTTRNWTVGTDDTAYRFRPLLLLATTSSYTPKSSQPDILRVIIGIRFPEIVRIVIPADDGVLDGYGLTAIDAEQNLRRLQNQGVVTFRRPGDTTTTFSAEIFSVTDTMYATKDGFAHGIQLQLRRWITP
ncbi:hypothetical protein LCGC14_0382690 [marine sediment metagenome]|uniref:Uncharacterized protein n=1 Tax=marine sediment metagenome TaxID=412755 RepID=A0A0F9T1W0_9ZZZZ